MKKEDVYTIMISKSSQEAIPYLQLVETYWVQRQVSYHNLKIGTDIFQSIIKIHERLREYSNNLIRRDLNIQQIQKY